MTFKFITENNQIHIIKADDIAMAWEKANIICLDCILLKNN
jgi:hypothetical protein